MKITLVVGGRWHAFDLARELQKNGHLHRIVTNYPSWFVKRWGIPGEKIVSLELTFWLIKAIYKIGGEALMMRCQWWIHSWFAKKAVNYITGSELIHGWSQWSEPSLRWAVRNGIPTVLERSSAQILEQSRLLREEYRRHGYKWKGTHPKIEEMELKEYELCDKIAIPSLFVQRSFIARGYPSEKLALNALGVDTSLFKPAEDILAGPTKVGLKVVYAGSLSIRKGIHDLIHGFRMARIVGSELRLLGGKAPEVSNLLREQPNNIIQLGHVPQKELVKHYALSHCFVLASIEEGMAMVQMQALATGLPLVCTSNTGGEDLLRLGGEVGLTEPMGVTRYPAGYVVPIHSPESIAYCLEQLSTKEGLWEKMRESALMLALNKLNWEEYGIRAINVYQDMIEKRI